MVTGLLKTGQVTSETTKGLGLGIGLVFRVRVSFKVSLFVLYFIYLYSVDGATGVSILVTRIGVPTLGSRTTAKQQQ